MTQLKVGDKIRIIDTKNNEEIRPYSSSIPLGTILTITNITTVGHIHVQAAGYILEGTEFFYKNELGVYYELARKSSIKINLYKRK